MMKPIWAAHVLIAEAPEPEGVPRCWHVPNSPHQDNLIVLEAGGGLQFQVDDDYYSGYLERDEALALAYAIIRNYGKSS